MRLMILENRRLRATLTAGPGAMSIGSGPECGVHLPDPRISPHQATIGQDDEGAWWLEVVDTTIPTCLNRAVQKGRARLRHADEIEMGAFSIRLFMESSKSREELQRERMLELTRRHGKGLPLNTIAHKTEDLITVPKEHIEQMTILAVRLEQMQTIGDLLMPILRAVLRTFEGRRAWIGIRSNVNSDLEWTLGLTGKGQPCDRPEFSRRMQIRVVDHTQYLCCPETPIDGVRSAMAVPLACQSGNLGMIYVENDPGDPVYDEAKLHMLSALAASVAMPVENVLRQSAAKRRAVTATQQTVARTTQDALTLSALPQWEQLAIAAYRHMGTSRCCDLYDIVQLRDKSAAIVVAKLNVPEPDLPRFFAEVRSMFRAAALYSEPPHLFARALNWLIFEGDKQWVVHVGAAWIDPSTGKVQFCLAGDGVRLGVVHADGTCTAADPAGMPAIGQTRAPAFESRALELDQGDALVLVSAGAELAKNTAGEVFGFSGLEDALCDGLGAPPAQVLSELDADLNAFIADGACPDDVTVVMVQRQ